MAEKVDYVQFLHDGSELLTEERTRTDSKGETEKNLLITLPVVKPNVIVPVIEIFLK